MLSRKKITIGDTFGRPQLDLAIIASVLAMGSLNLLVLADQLGSTKAYAAAPCRCGTIAGVALA
jgi:hypothetical protein